MYKIQLKRPSIFAYLKRFFILNVKTVAFKLILIGNINLVYQNKFTLYKGRYKKHMNLLSCTSNKTLALNLQEKT